MTHRLFIVNKTTTPSLKCIPDYVNFSHRAMGVFECVRWVVYNKDFFFMPGRASFSSIFSCSLIKKAGNLSLQDGIEFYDGANKFSIRAYPILYAPFEADIKI